MGNALSAPVINDVATNIEDPPVFTQSKHPAALSDAAKQACRTAYAHIKPLEAPSGDASAVFAAAKRAVGALPRARVVHEDAASGVIEALDITRLVRYRDDVAIRVRQAGGTVVVDVRSASRVGRGDMGANAARIAAYLAALRKELGLAEGQQ